VNRRNAKLFAGGGRGAAGGVVAIASAGGELALAVRRNDVNVDAAVGTVFCGIRRIVGKRVLMADIVSNLLADGVNVADVFREVGNAAGGLGNGDEGLTGILGGFLGFLAQETDGVDHRVGALNFLDGFLERIAAGVVFAVGNDKENLLFLVTFLEMIEGADDGVVESSAAASVDAFESFLEFGNTAGEILVEIEVEVVVEIDDKGFVLRITALDESDGGLVHAGALVAHAAAVVDDEAHADGNIFAFEDGELLLDLVFVDAEIFLGQAVDEFATVVEHAGVQDDEVDVELDFAAGLGGGAIGIDAGRRGRRRVLDGNLGEAGRGKEEENEKKKQVPRRARNDRLQSWMKCTSRSTCATSGQGRSNRSWNRQREAGDLWEGGA